MFLVFAVSLIILSGFVSAQYYGMMNNDYNRRTYHSTYENNGQFRATDYDRATTSGWVNGQYVSSTTYTRTTRDSPSYNNYRNYNSGYYTAPNYPWYQNYWTNQPTYYRQNPNYYGNMGNYNYGMMNSYPRNYYSFRY